VPWVVLVRWVGFFLLFCGFFSVESHCISFSVFRFQFLVSPLIYVITDYYSELYLSRMCGADCCCYGGQRGCVCVCAVYLWTGLGFLSFVEVVFSTGVLGLRKRGSGFFMVGRSLRGCLSLRWGVWYARRLGDYLLCILRVCEIVRLCLCGLLSCDSVIPA
jgi:hypothetical protein